MKKIRLFLKWFLYISVGIIIIGYLLPNNISSPISKSEITKIDPESFWYYPWGESGVHKGVDIFCTSGTTVFSPVSGIVYSRGYGSISGNYVYIIGPKWRTYYFAHLATVLTSQYSFVNKGEVIGKAGNTGNALNKPTHVHFSIKTLLPYFWLYDKNDIGGWKKMFYLDPSKEISF
jgi:peptidoglycan LD-endopeptidase LytH